MTSNSMYESKAVLEEYYAEIFSRLREQDIEQFYAHYQLWVLRRRASLLEEQLKTLREHLAEHRQISQRLQPSALALAVLARLQSNGVTDIDLLDLLLDRGEDWLDGMMQRLDYCEQVEDFIQGDYTQWCIKSLEGAYDWIDTLLGSIKEENGHYEPTDTDAGTTEALLLQKLRTDDEETMLEVTNKHPAISSPFDNETASAESEPAIQPDDENEPAPELLGWQDLESLDISIEDETSTIHPSAPIETTSTNQELFVPEEEISSKEAAKEIQETEQAEVAGDITTTANESELLTEEQETEHQVSEEITTTPSDQHILLEEAQVEELHSFPEEHPASAEIIQEEAASTGIIPAEQRDPAKTIPETLQERQEEHTETYREETPVLSESIQEEQIELPEIVQDEQAEQTEAIQEGQEMFPAEEAIPQPAFQVIANHKELSAETPDEPAEAWESAAQATDDDELPPLAEPVEAAEVRPLLAENEHLSLEKAEESEQPEQSEEVEEGSGRNESQSVDISEIAEVVEEPGEQQENVFQVSFDEEELPVEIPEETGTREDELFSDAYHEEQEHEIEMAAIVNDILSTEEEQSEQLPWYEYLDLKERGTPATPGPVEEHSEPASSGTDTDEADIPALHEHSTDAEPRSQESKPTQEAILAEDVSEIEGWQTWQNTAAEEETLPFALKDLQPRKEEASELGGRETLETQETQDGEPSTQASVTEQNREGKSPAETPLEQAGQENTIGKSEISGVEDESNVPDMDTTPLEIARRESSANVRSVTNAEHTGIERLDTAKLEVAVAQSRPVQEMGVGNIGKPPEGATDTASQPGSNPVHRAGGTFKPRVVRTDIEHVAMNAPGEYPPRKRGFWQWLFGFWRKGKQRSRR